MPLELLLSEGGQPVLPQGLAPETLVGVPPPVRGEAPGRLWDVNRNPNELPRQRWGLVAPEGPEGDRLLALVEPLRQARQEAQGGRPVRVYRVPSPERVRLDGAGAARWKKQVFRREPVAEADLPRYLLLLGDLDQVPLELQQALATDAFVGRLAFSSEEGYASYVAKVLRWESSPSRESRARMLFYTARDGTSATESGHWALMAPSLEACRKGPGVGDFPAVGVCELGGGGEGDLEQLLAQVAEPGPGVLLTLSHGQRASQDWRARQGALVLPGGRCLTGAQIASRPFLPGGIWFCYACYSAGTPARSSYAHWLRQLEGLEPEVARSLSSALLPEGEKPFIAALPKAALANPDGPLAVIGHVDLAWSCSFNDQGRRAPGRFLGLLKSLAEGGRAGVAMSALLRFVNETSMELTMLHHQQEKARLAGLPSAIDPEMWALLWILHQDLSNFILLGDPAVRLPLASRSTANARQGSSAGGLAAVGLAGFSRPRSSSPREPVAAEAAVLALLAGRGSPDELAAQHGISARELRRWEDLYRAAGRAALGRHLTGEG
jgi:hypothetical protein